MFVTVERASLLEAVTKLQRVVGNKTSMPVLEGILLSAEQEKSPFWHITLKWV